MKTRAVFFYIFLQEDIFMKGFKVFNPDWTCRDFKYEVGKTYKHEGEIELCKSGFHFCEKLSDCFRFYELSTDNHVAEIEAIGNIKTDSVKSVTNEIKIVKELDLDYVFEKLSEDKDWHVRTDVARNPNTPVNVLEKLSEDKDWYVRTNVARNPNTPVNILEKLSEDKDNYVRAEVARNLNTPVNILEKLSEDENEDVRTGAAINLNTPVNILKKLFEDEIFRVRTSAKEKRRTKI